MASSPPMPGASLTGAVLSRRWRVGRKLGEGGMGEVYAGAAVSGGSPVAIKRLRGEFLSDPDLQFRFLEEARTCMRLVHPNIVRVLECARAEDGAPYIVMELLEGVPLGAYMRDGARVPVEHAAPIVLAILAALGAAHAQGIVHRDLKPDNVILTRDGSGVFVVKLLDFGIAKVMDAAGGMGSRTRTGILLGTPAYMSPEQARSARDVDQRADLWSVGVLFYEMVSGRVAFPAPTEYARLAALLTTEPEPLGRIDPSLAQLESFVQRALKKDREERFSTATEMAQVLARTAAFDASRGPDRGGLPLIHPVPFIVESSPLRPAVLRPRQPAPGLADAPDPSFDRLGASLSPKTPARGGDGTLASPKSPSPRASYPSPGPEVVIVQQAPFGETLPSTEHGPGGRAPASGGPSRGVALHVVALLIVVALLAGIALGWTASRLP